MVKPTTHSAYCFVSGQSDPSKTPTSSKFVLSIRQQPQRAKVCGVKERDRRPIDPPPIIQIKLAEPSTDKNKDYLQSPYLFMCCNLVHANEPEGEIVAPAHRALAGTVVSSLNRLKDVDNSDGGFFVFGDMSARIEGRFRLRFTLFELVEGQVVHVMSIASNPVTVHSSKTFPGMCESTFLSRSFSDQGVRIRIRKDHHVKPKRPVNESPDADEEEENRTSVAMHSPPSSCHDGDPSDHDSSHDTQPAKRTKPSTSSSSTAAASTGSKPITIASRSRHHRSTSRYSSEEASERTPPSSPGPYVAFGSAPSWGRHHPYRLDLSPRRYEDPRYSASLRFRDPYYEPERPSAFYEGLHIEANSRRFEHPGFSRTTLVHHPREIRGGRPEHGYPVEYAAQRERSRSFGHPRYVSTSSIGYFHHPFEDHGPYWVEGHPVYFHGPEPPPHAIALAHPPSAAFNSPQGAPLSHVTPTSKSSKSSSRSRIIQSARHGFPAALLNDEEMEDVSSDKQHDVLHSRTPSMSSQHSESNFSPPHPFSPSEFHPPIMNYGPGLLRETSSMRNTRLQTPTSPHAQGHHVSSSSSRSSLSSAGGDERIHLPPIHTLSTHSPVTSLKSLATFPPPTRAFS
ncbi:MAG: velvet factor-domain-containing protein [Linnemannia elongata]|nr:MAG: velvet factor-domain-containing protein [Linnemannia elongata]